MDSLAHFFLVVLCVLPSAHLHFRSLEPGPRLSGFLYFTSCFTCSRLSTNARVNIYALLGCLVSSSSKRSPSLSELSSRDTSPLS